jgi:hypothetical protein
MGKYVPETTRAAVAAAVGDLDRAFYWLEAGLTARVPAMTRLPPPDDSASRAAQVWKPLMQDPRYESLRERLDVKS